MDYENPHDFGYEIILGFRQMAEPAGYSVDIIPVTEKLQKSYSYDTFMLKHDYLAPSSWLFFKSTPG